MTLRVKLVTRIEWRCSGLADLERIRRTGDLERGERERSFEKERLRGEGDLEYGDLGEGLNKCLINYNDLLRCIAATLVGIVSTYMFLYN